MILGPHRVYPGRLSVSRSFGDIEAKLPRYGGNMGVIVADPEIRKFRITKEMDYVILACDGIFDKCTSLEVNAQVWEGLVEERGKDVHEQCGISVDRILKTSVAKKTMDNITVVFVAFEGFNLRGFGNGVEDSSKSNLSQPFGGGSTGSSGDFPTLKDQQELEKKGQI